MLAAVRVLKQLLKATIESLQVQDLGIPEIIINEEMEVGIKISCQASKNSRIIFIKDILTMSH